MFLHFFIGLSTCIISCDHFLELLWSGDSYKHPLHVSNEKYMDTCMKIYSCNFLLLLLIWNYVWFFFFILGIVNFTDFEACLEKTFMQGHAAGFWSQMRVITHKIYLFTLIIIIQ